MLSEQNPMIDDQIRFWRARLKSTITEALKLTPDDKLDYAPALDMIPLGKLFLHIAECSDWWYDEIMKGKDSIELAFPNSPCPPKAKVAIHMEEHWQRLERFFAEPSEILAKTYTKALKDRTIEKDGYWIFTHLLEHDIHHRSQINQYLRILGIKPPAV